ncbi:MAG TPA: condensation domain-containing protein, partial [Thermoanaerobaculia bacterium]
MSGEIEYLGRIDTQVKVRGFRIELGEVEAALGSLSGVKAAVVLAVGEGSAKRLVAYVEPTGERQIAGSELRKELAAELPEPWVPSAYVVLDRLPLNPNGKVDRLALSRRESGELEADSRSYEPPRTPVEELLAGLWSRLLNVARVGRQESFFELGGHSLLATRLMSRIGETFGVELPLRTLFETPTVAGLAESVERALAAGRSAASPLMRAERTGPLPLSFAQERLWFLEQLEPGSGSYHLPSALRLTGRLDVAALGRSLSEIVRRHEALRTVFRKEGGAARQEVLAPSPLPLPLPVVDLSAVPEPGRAAEAQRLASLDAQRPFDLSHGPLLRSSLLRLGGESWIALLNVHHIASDGWSQGVLIGELVALYAAFVAGHPSQLAELPIQYADFALWQRQWLTGEVLASQIRYWREELSGAPPVLLLPTDRPRPAVQTFRGRSFGFVLAAELAEGLRETSRRSGATLFMTLLAGFEALLSRLSGQSDVLVGTAVANRTRLETEDLIGFFVNTLVLRGRLRENPTWSAHLAQVRRSALGAYAHQDLPFERLVEELSVPRSLAHSPLFQAMLLLQNTPDGALALPGLELAPVEVASATAKFDLTLSLSEDGEEIQGTAEFSTDLFDETTVQRFLGAFETLLAGAVGEPEAPISDLPLLSAAERQQLLSEWSGAEVPYPRTATLHELFAEQAALRPGLVALAFGEEKVSYADLNRRANRLAQRLRRLGVESEGRVGVLCERSIEMVVAMLASLKAGGAYVPLDPELPTERLQLLVQETALTAIVAQDRWLSRLPEGLSCPVVAFERDAADLAGESAEAPPSSSVAESLAYVLFTSGSTGRPKGVLVPHRAVVRLVRSGDGFARFGPDEVFLQLAPASFDAATLEIWGPLLTGGRLAIFPAERPTLSGLGEAIA